MRPITALRAGGLTIGRLARLTQVNIETIRYYERIGMLPPPPRTAGGHRVYGAVEMHTLTFIRRARELGFALDEIRGLLALGGPGKASCAEVQAIASHHLEHIRAKIADLGRLEQILSATIAQCSGGGTPECPVIDVLVGA